MIFDKLFSIVRKEETGIENREVTRSNPWQPRMYEACFSAPMDTYTPPAEPSIVRWRLRDVETI